MKNLYELEIYRVKNPKVKALYGSTGDQGNGVFVVKSNIDQVNLNIIASTSPAWEHVSVSRKNRCPNWPEMDQIKRLFFLPDEVVIQYHVAEEDHINVHPYCLHLWRPLNQEIPLPPKWMIA